MAIRPSAIGAARLVLPAVALVFINACSSTPEPAEPTPSGAEQLIVALGNSDIALGPNRLVFAILEEGVGPVRLPETSASFYYLEATPAELRTETTARFVKWPAGTAGVYVANVTFDDDGRWGLVVAVPDGEGSSRIAQTGFIVKPRSSSPAIGEPAPLSVNKTDQDVTDLSELTTAPVPDPDLYRMTIADAAATGRPTVVTFGTPAYCETATCGPQLDVVSSLKDKYRQRANFIHVEVYDNPNEIEGDLSRAKPSPLLEEWGLVSEPFTFVLDGEGVVAFKYEGFATMEELETGLTAALGR